MSDYKYQVYLNKHTYKSIDKINLPINKITEIQKIKTAAVKSNKK